MRATFAAGLLLLSACAVQAPEDEPVASTEQALGEPILTDAGFVFPNWEERVLFVLTNRARSDPQKQQGECQPGAYKACPWVEASDGGCYTPQPPLVWDLNLSRGARFHATYLGKAGVKLGHDNCCTLRTDVATSGCDGDPACACAASTNAGTCMNGCSGAITSASTRVSRFTSGYSGEIAHQVYTDPLTVFHGFVDEELAPTMPNGNCSFNPGNGHRWLILKNGGPRVGSGYFSGAGAQCNRYWVQDFATGAVAIPRIPGAIHYPKAGSPSTMFDFWANWYHLGGTAPSRSAVVINGNCRTMPLEFGTVQNGTYHYRGTVAAGCQPYYFLFVDSAGTRVTYPTVGSLTVSSTTACANDYAATQLPADCEGAGGGAGGGGGSGGGSGTGGAGGGAAGGSGTGGAGGAGGGAAGGSGTGGAGGGAAGGSGTGGAAGGGSGGAGGSGVGGGSAAGGGSGSGGGTGGTSGTGGGSAGGSGLGGGGATTTTGGCGCSSGGELIFPLILGAALLRRRRAGQL